MRVTPGDVGFGGAIDPHAVVGYLRVSGWTKLQEIRRHGSLVAALMGRDGVETRVPLLADAVDFASLLADLVNKVASTEKRPSDQLLADLRLFRTDVIRLRRTGRDDHEIPLADAATLFAAAHGLVAAASMATSLPPRASFSGKRPDEVADFLRDAMIGQTEPGSFVVRVLVPLPLIVGDPQVSLPYMDEEPPDPFGRRVTVSLVKALGEVRAALTQSAVDNSMDPFREVVSHGVSADLCRALAMVDGHDHQRGLEVSVAWGLSSPRPRVKPVSFTRADLQVLGQAAAALGEMQVREEFDLEGYITKLARDGSTEGDITVAANIEGQVRKVLVGLRPNEYREACRAHPQELKVRAVGDLGKDGRQYRLNNPRRFQVFESDALSND
jgi:hypothetical protein